MLNPVLAAEEGKVAAGVDGGPAAGRTPVSAAPGASTCSVPPLTVEPPVNVLAPERIAVPALTVRPPANVFALLRVSVLAPFLVTEPDDVRTPESAMLPPVVSMIGVPVSTMPRDDDQEEPVMAPSVPPERVDGVDSSAAESRCRQTP